MKKCYIKPETKLTELRLSDILTMSFEGAGDGGFGEGGDAGDDIM